MCNYNFTFADSQPLGKFMRDKQVEKMVLHERLDGSLWAVGKQKGSDDYVVIPLATTVSGLHLELNVCWVTNPNYRNHPREFMLICRSKFADLEACDLRRSVRINLKRRGR